MNSEALWSIARTILSMLGATLVTNHLATAPDVAQASTDVMTIGPALVSLISFGIGVYKHWGMRKVPANAIPPVITNTDQASKFHLGCVAFIAGLTLFALADQCHAQAGKFRSPSGNMLTGDPFKDFGQQPKQVDILKALDAAILPDLQYALRIANATNSKLTANCYQAWIDIITARQKSLSDDKGNEIPEPSPHVITDFEKAVEIRNALQPDSPFMVACSPVANMIKTDIINFIGKVLAGGAGIAALVPGL
ncbi:MAG: hypothetical protein KGJ13_06630 [Patescibacteria group bacterium]|nr:hypothetical protein [Patescibacteria group bacterium]